MQIFVDKTIRGAEDRYLEAKTNGREKQRHVEKIIFHRCIIFRWYFTEYHIQPQKKTTDRELVELQK